MARETSQTFDRGLQLLELLAGADDALSVTDLAGALGVARPVVYRLLATLEDHGLALADDVGRYRAGLGLARLTGRVVPALRATAEPHLRVLADTVGATAHLTMAVVEPSATSVHLAYRTGRRHPLALGAAGRAILGARSGRPKRWYVTTGELESGATGLAVPLGLDGVEASVGVVTVGTIAERTIGPAVVRAAEAIRSSRPRPKPSVHVRGSDTHASPART
jgi:AcrR family transcriptional regulator